MAFCYLSRQKAPYRSSPWISRRWRDIELLVYSPNLSWLIRFHRHDLAVKKSRRCERISWAGAEKPKKDRMLSKSIAVNPNSSSQLSCKTGQKE